MSTEPSGVIIATTSTNDIKILDASGALTETLTVDKRVKLAKFAPNSDSVAILSFFGSQAQVWNLKNKQKLYDISIHGQSQISDVCFTPLAGLVAVCSDDCSWSLHDYEQGKVLLHLREQAQIKTLQIHPDGLIMALGLSNGKILVYDIRDMQLAHEVEAPEGSGAVSQLAFSNKGRWLAASWHNSDSCRVYNPLKGFSFVEVKQEGVPVKTFSFDLYGGFLAVGTAKNLTVCSYKNWKKTLTTLRPFENGSDAIR